MPHFAWHDYFPLTFYLKLLNISDLIVADIDKQSVLSMVYKYPKILWMSGFLCGRVDFRIYSSTLRVPLILNKRPDTENSCLYRSIECLLINYYDNLAR